LRLEKELKQAERKANFMEKECERYKAQYQSVRTDLVRALTGQTVSEKDPVAEALAAELNSWREANLT